MASLFVSILVPLLSLVTFFFNRSLAVANAEPPSSLPVVYPATSSAQHHHFIAHVTPPPPQEPPRHGGHHRHHHHDRQSHELFLRPRYRRGYRTPREPLLPPYPRPSRPVPRIVVPPYMRPHRPTVAPPHRRPHKYIPRPPRRAAPAPRKRKTQPPQTKKPRGSLRGFPRHHEEPGHPPRKHWKGPFRKSFPGKHGKRGPLKGRYHGKTLDKAHRLKDLLRRKKHRKHHSAELEGHKHSLMAKHHHEKYYKNPKQRDNYEHSNDGDQNNHIPQPISSLGKSLKP